MAVFMAIETAADSFTVADVSPPAARAGVSFTALIVKVAVAVFDVNPLAVTV